VALLLPPVVFAPLIIIPLRQVVKAGELYYGGTESFWSDTVMSLSKAFFYYRANSLATYILPVLILCCILTALYMLYKRIKLKRWEKAKSWPLLLMLVLPALGSIVQHWLLNKPYLIDRTALFLIPLSLLLLIAVLQQGSHSKAIGNNLKVSLKYSLSLFAVLTFVLGFNLSYLSDFKEHTDTEKMLVDLSEYKSQDESNIVLGKSTYMNATINYYKLKLGLDWLQNTELTFCNDEGERRYYYLFNSDVNCVDNMDIRVLEYYPISDTYLILNQNYNNFK